MDVKLEMLLVGLIACGLFSGVVSTPLTEVKGETTSENHHSDSPRIARVQLKQGEIFTQVQTAGDGQSEYYAFKGIPYAQSPTGDLRFKDPVPASPWTEPRNGSFVAPVCPQGSRNASRSNETIGHEDCLYLNVFTPNPYGSALPVMVFIHGGGFQEGDMALYPGEPLVTRGVVHVIIQYRLGTLGFLSTEDSVIPGNLGLKDQTLALRWIQENIQEFGGDPQRVTIFGESSGGASAHFHMLSPLSRGLFHRAIMQSGTATCPWATAEGHRDIAVKVGQKFNCSGLESSSGTTWSSRLLSCLQEVPTEELVKASQEFGVLGPLPVVMLPRVDGVFLTDHPAQLMKEGKYNQVDIISGITKDEGGIVARAIFSNEEWLNTFKYNWTSTGHIILIFGETDEDPVYLSRRSFYYYLGNSVLSENKAEDFKDLLSDRTFRMCHDETSQWHSRDAVFGRNVYRYEFQHRGQYSMSDLTYGTVGEEWVTHGDELFYLFNFTSYPFKSMKKEMDLSVSLETDSDLFVSDIMLTLWTNFAATGNPTPNQSLGFRWTPTAEFDYSYLAITPTPFMADDYKYQERELWNNLPTHQNKILHPELFSIDQ